jgi:hypothetical protein
MRLLLSLLLVLPAMLAAQVRFEDHFEDRALRIDLYQTGDGSIENVTLGRVVREGPWPERTDRLIEPFQNGRYRVTVYDVASNAPLYARGFDCMFGEYRTTTPAREGVTKVFERSIRVPMPKRPARVVLERRDRENIPRPLFTMALDPKDLHIIRENPDSKDQITGVMINGEPRTHVDIVFLAEGYAAGEREKFNADIDRLSHKLFEVEPYAGARTRFNLRGVFRPSPESGTDEPRQGIFKKTALHSSFNTFDLDRYLLTEENHRLREMAGQVPYDAIVILVNSPRYGGGGIYNDYCMTTVDNARSAQVFVHEFGHAFGGLADEYYTSDVAYNEFYPQGVEPLEPNITALLDPAHLKWSHLAAPGIALPTPYGKEAIDSLLFARPKVPEAARREIDARIDSIKKVYAPVYGKVGAFEGAGYASRGLYRPMVYCLMINNPKNEFCLVCREALARMIDFYAVP